jgi:hypothetical protein
MGVVTLHCNGVTTAFLQKGRRPVPTNPGQPDLRSNSDLGGSGSIISKNDKSRNNQGRFVNFAKKFWDGLSVHEGT